ncbi:hypothetical protein VTK26DRAFT_605 [Humicola hyalothermophila]
MAPGPDEKNPSGDSSDSDYDTCDIGTPNPPPSDSDVTVLTDEDTKEVSEEETTSQEPVLEETVKREDETPAPSQPGPASQDSQTQSDGMTVTGSESSLVEPARLPDGQTGIDGMAQPESESPAKAADSDGTVPGMEPTEADGEVPTPHQDDRREEPSISEVSIEKQDPVGEAPEVGPEASKVESSEEGDAEEENQPTPEGDENGADGQNENSPGEEPQEVTTQVEASYAEVPEEDTPAEDIPVGDQDQEEAPAKEEETQDNEATPAEEEETQENEEAPAKEEEKEEVEKTQENEESEETKPESEHQHDPFTSAYSDDNDSDSEDTESDGTPKPMPSRPGMPLLPALGRRLLAKTIDNANLSPAEREWERRKSELGEKSKALDKLMSMVGLEEVKQAFLAIKSAIATAKQRKGRLRRQDLNLALMGNLGTGKRTLAPIYRDLLTECGVWSGTPYFEHYTGLDLKGTANAEELNNTLKRMSDGRDIMLFIDGVEEMSSSAGNYLLYTLEAHANRLNIVIMVTGTVDRVNHLLAGRPNGRWVFPRLLRLEDYDDEQLRRILVQLVHHSSFTPEGGDDGPYMRLAAKRVGRGRGSAGYANVYDLILAFGKMVQRQAARLEKEGVRVSGDKGVSPDTKTKTEEQEKIEEAHNGENAAKDTGKEKSKEEPASGKSTANDDGTNDGEREGSGNNNTTGEEEAIAPETPGPDLSLLTREDLIGPEPEDIRSRSEAWKELEKMAGLESVKKAIGELLTRAKANYHRELLGKEPLQTSLNRVFIGPPGTGKTTVAKLYGKIIGELGLLSTKEVVYKTPADFIGQYIGDSEANTSAILDSTIGKVLIIDDAHMFYQGSRGGSHETDCYRVAVIDTIVAKIHNKPGEDRCVILLGYPDLMEEMFRKVNPGLRRRFPLEEAFRFHNYDDASLNKILRLKMEREDITATEHAMEVAAEVLRRARDRPNFGNGGDVDNLLNQAKTRFRERTAAAAQKNAASCASSSSSSADLLPDSLIDIEHRQPMVLTASDFDPEWDRGAYASSKCASLFQGMIGFESIIAQFQGYQRMAANLRRRGRDPRQIVPFTFLFKGPPGTGKTHTARIVGQIFYDMGFLSTPEVVECSASALIGQYRGHTAPRVVDLFERALGKVLFIDEAYRLAGGSGDACNSGSFEAEAVGEMVDCMTKTRYLRKMVIVLAGYEHDMNALMRVNPGLRGRFATEVVFPPMSPARMREHLVNLLRKEDIEVWDGEGSEADPQVEEKRQRLLRGLRKLSATSGWSNGRDIKTLADVITGSVYKNADLDDGNGDGAGMFRVSTAELCKFVQNMLMERMGSSAMDL